MLSALVTTVSAGEPWARSGRPARARATSVVVVPPVRPITSPGVIRAATASLMRRFSAARREVR